MKTLSREDAYERAEGDVFREYETDVEKFCEAIDDDVLFAAAFYTPPASTIVGGLPYYIERQQKRRELAEAGVKALHNIWKAFQYQTTREKLSDNERILAAHVDRIMNDRIRDEAEDVAEALREEQVLRGAL